MHLTRALDEELEAVSSEICCKERKARRRIRDLEALNGQLEEQIKELQNHLGGMGPEYEDDNEDDDSDDDEAGGNAAQPEGKPEEEDPEEKEIMEVEPEEEPEPAPTPPELPGRNIYMQLLRNFEEGRDEEDDYDEEEWFPK